MFHRTRILSFVLLPLVVAQARTSSLPLDDPINAVLKSVKEKFAPDRRVAVFDVSYEAMRDGVVLKGEVDNPAAKDELFAGIHKVSTASLIDSIRVLPDPSLGENVYGIVSLSVANMRSKPGESEELCTQVLMGMVVKILKKQGGWMYVQSHDHYLGWIDPGSFFVTNRTGVDGWAAARKVIVTGYFGVVREQPAANGQPVCDLVIGNILKFNDSKDQWTSVQFADGRRGYIESSLVEDYDGWKHARTLNGKNIETTARMFVGVPYLWGGTSSKGMDCSGFTKTVYRLNGMELNRDANQQATMGEDVSPGENFDNLKKGDLMFFGRKATPEKPERITHVAIYLENRGFIHSSGNRVKFGSFDPASSYYDGDFRIKGFVRARRVIPTTDVPEVRK